MIKSQIINHKNNIIIKFSEKNAYILKWNYYLLCLFSFTFFYFRYDS